MVVTIRTYPDIEEGIYETMVECDRIHKTRCATAVKVLMYKDSKLVHDLNCKEKIKVFIMENGKTIDRIDFTPKT